MSQPGDLYPFPNLNPQPKPKPRNLKTKVWRLLKKEGKTDPMKYATTITKTKDTMLRAEPKTICTVDVDMFVQLP